ncbi:MAG: nucleotidyl transferase AbiEii/AbiGii toxin family protein [Faecalibacillus sp.]
MFSDILEACYVDTGIPRAIIEKDYYVTLLLQKIVENCPEIIFKGGTSISKCYKVINRFSEDIDLGLNIDRATQGMRRDLKYQIIKAIKELNLKIDNEDHIYSRTYFNRYQIKYPLLEKIILLKPYLYVETALFLKPFPYEIKEDDSYVYQFLTKKGQNDLINQFHLHPFEIKVQTLERTFIDKLFALGDYYLSDKVTSHSRHLYDLYKLYEYITFNDDFYHLFKEVAEIRSHDSECLLAKADQDLKQLLKIIYENDYFKKDYEDITCELLFEKISYQVVKDNLLRIINQLSN